MRYEPATFYGETVTGEDALGNETKESVVIGVYSSRLAELTIEELSALGRDYTHGDRKLVTRAAEAVCRQAVKVDAGGISYKVMRLIGTDKDRWRILYLEGTMI